LKKKKILSPSFSLTYPDSIFLYKKKINQVTLTVTINKRSIHQSFGSIIDMVQKAKKVIKKIWRSFDFAFLLLFGSNSM